MDSWVAIDFETANDYRGSPCAVALAAVEGDSVVQQYTTFIQPPPAVSYFSPFCVSLHGITAAHVRDAPSWPEAITGIVRFINGRAVVAHNAAFDMGVVRDACDETGVRWPELSYACTLVVARRTWPLISYSLPWVADAAGHTLADHHDPSADAMAAAAVMIAAKRFHGIGSLHDLLRSMRVRPGQLSGDKWMGCRFEGAPRARAALPGANPNADPDGLFYGLSICFTGTLSSMTRDYARHLVAEAGGQPVPGVSKKTDLLVIGTQDHRRFAPGAMMSSKHSKAAALRNAGYPIEVIAEPDFLERLAATEGLAMDLTTAI
jgi:DNA polymerase III epsilon subunit-like protein